MDNNQSLEKRVRRTALFKATGIFVGIPTVALAITSTLYYMEKDRKEENKVKPPAIIQPVNPDYSPQMSDLYTPDVISQTDVGYVK